MKTAAFIRHAPRSIEEVLEILADVAPKDGRILAGGQSLVPIMAFRMAEPAHLVDINNVDGLDRLAIDGDDLSLAPSCVTPPFIARSLAARSDA